MTARQVLFVALLAGFVSAPAFGAPLKIFAREEGSFRTNLSGEPNPRPPFAQVIRTSSGLNYALSLYERMMDRYMSARLEGIKNKFGTIDFNEKMLLCVFSQPLDHFKLRLEGVEQANEQTPIKVRVKYRHDARLVRKSGQKNIFYIILVIPKSGQPALLEAEDEAERRREALEPEQVTGVLMEFGEGQVQLVVEKAKRGKKSTFYVRNADMEALKDHFGKSVTIEGYVKPEGLSAYEREMTYLRLVKENGK